MVFEPNFRKVVSSVRRNIGITQSVVELKLPTNEDATRVYSVGAKASILSVNSSEQNVGFSGLVDFQVMYQGELVSALDYSAEFQDSYVAQEPIMGEVVLSCNVIDVNSSVVGGGIRVVAIVETIIDEIVSKGLNVLIGVGGDSHVSTKDICYSTYIGKAYEKFDVSGDVQVDGALSVLMVTPCISLYGVMPKDNYMIVNGKLNLDICYTTGDSVNDIMTKYHSMDFSWEVALDGMNSDSIVQSVVSLISNEVKVSTMIEEGVANISLFVPISYTGYVFVENKLEIVEDVYLERNYMSITCENFETIRGERSVCFKDNVSGTASISDTAPFIDEILGVTTNNLVLASSRVENDKLYLEGVANSTVVYYTKETGDVTSVQVEMPFAVEEKVEGCESNVVTICLENISARSKRGKEIEVSAELNVFSDMFCEQGGCAITDVVLGEEKPQDDCALYVYIVKPGQTMWDVAKDVNVSQELILEQNPEVELPIKAGDKLVVYRPSVMQF